MKTLDAESRTIEYLPEGHYLSIKKLSPDAVLPTPKHVGDAGMDLVSVEAVWIHPGEVALVSTGLSMAVPYGYGGFVLPRSGLASKGITVVNSPGLIDSGYRGIAKVALINLTKNDYRIEKGDRIAQLVIMPYLPVTCTEVSELPATERGEGGFGSTGR